MAMAQLHDDSGENPTVTKPNPFFMCNFCNKDFTKDWNRRRHELKFHIGTVTVEENPVQDTDTPPEASLVCSVCQKVFSNSSNKRAHERRQHGVKPGPRSYADGPSLVKCKECSVAFGTLNDYRKHLLDVHHIESHKARHVFTSEEEFSDWKDTLEMDIGVNYTAHSGPRKCSEGTKQILYCRRSGVKLVKNSNNKRAGKRQGTCKMGFYCTSTIEVVKNGEKIYVTLYSDHHDHDLDSNSLIHMTLPRSEQDKIAVGQVKNCIGPKLGLGDLTRVQSFRSIAPAVTKRSANRRQTPRDCISSPRYDYTRD